MSVSFKMQEDLKRYASKLREEGRAPIEIRVGLNTGEMVVRTIETGVSALGELLKDAAGFGRVRSSLERLSGFSKLQLCTASKKLR